MQAHQPGAGSSAVELLWRIHPHAGWGGQRRKAKQDLACSTSVGPGPTLLQSLPAGAGVSLQRCCAAPRDR
jgi:hypothetical protein